jgi:hypothetical protein
VFRKFRILVLLLILLAVAVQTWRADVRLTSWEYTARVAIYPIAADTSPDTARFIRELNPDSFTDIEDWLQEEVRRYGFNTRDPVKIWLGPEIREMPPTLSQTPNMLNAILWSLKLRWWAYWHDDLEHAPTPHVRLFVLFHDAKRHTTPLPHSIGMKKGKIGVIHVFANQAQKQQNAVIITHELLHTFGATDKYDLATLQPLYPQGYADPEQFPLLPQTRAEIMGGRIPINREASEIPPNLSKTRIGPATAYEIGLGGKE